MCESKVQKAEIDGTIWKAREFPSPCDALLNEQKIFINVVWQAYRSSLLFSKKEQIRVATFKITKHYGISHSMEVKLRAS